MCPSGMQHQDVSSIYISKVLLVSVTHCVLAAVNHRQHSNFQEFVLQKLFCGMGDPVADRCATRSCQVMGTMQKRGWKIPHHVPEFVESHNEAGAHPPESFKGPDVNFDPYPLLNTSEELAQRTACAH